MEVQQYLSCHALFILTGFNSRTLSLSQTKQKQKQITHRKLRPETQEEHLYLLGQPEQGPFGSPRATPHFYTERLRGRWVAHLPISIFLCLSLCQQSSAHRSESKTEAGSPRRWPPAPGSRRLGCRTPRCGRSGTFFSLLLHCAAVYSEPRQLHSLL